MAKKMRRVLALVLALALCAGQLAVPVSADEAEGTLSVTATVTAAEDLPAGTTEIPGGSIEKTVDTDTDTVSDNGINTTTTVTQENWTGSTTEGGAIPGADPNTTESTKTSETVTTEITGSETTTDVAIDNGPQYPMSESTTVTGQETTTTTTTTVEEKTVDGEGDGAQNTVYENNGQWEQTGYTPGTPDTVTNRDEVTTDDANVPQPGGATLEMTQQNPTDEYKEEGNIEAAASANGITREAEEKGITDEVTTSTTGDKKSEAGEVTVTKTPIKSKDGTVIGYQIVTTTVKETETPLGGGSADGTSLPGAPTTSTDPTVDGGETVSYIMPEEPEAGVTTDADGNTVTTTVEKIEENGEHVGWKTITVTTGQDGVELERGTESIYRTKVTTGADTGSTTTTTVTQTPVTETKITQVTTTTVTDVDGRELVLVTDENGYWGWVYRAELEKVIAEGTHGDVDMDSLIPSLENKQDGTVDTTNDLYNRPASTGRTNTNLDFNGYNFKWLGEYGLESAIRVQSSTASTWQPHQFVLENQQGEKFYVYCADFEVSPQKFFRYDMENLEDATYYNSDDAKHIRAIAEAGFWGTSEGIGSLEAVRQLMRDSGKFTTAEIDSLTPGEALTATQAAIWKYGNSGDASFGSDIVGAYYNKDKSFNYNYSNNTVQKLYDYLITLTENPGEGTTLITENNFATEASITVYDKVEDAQANLDSNDNNDVYRTDVSFSLLVEPTAQDDLVVSVLDSSNNVIRKVRVAGDSSNDDSSLFSKLFKNDDKTYTIKDLEIAEGVNITLNLSGTQHLDRGVYLYTSEVRTDLSSQTFVGLAEGERDVNLNVDLKFEVIDPQADVKTTDQVKTTTQNDTRTEQRAGTRYEADVKTHISVTTTVAEETSRAWTREKSKTYTYEYDLELFDDDWGDEDEDDDDGIDILDEEVPLAAAPRTGDSSLLWVLCSGLSAAGMFLLRKKREDGE